MASWTGRMFGVYGTIADEQEPPIALFSTREDAQDWIATQDEYSCDLTILETGLHGDYDNGAAEQEVE